MKIVKLGLFIGLSLALTPMQTITTPDDKPPKIKPRKKLSAEQVLGRADYFAKILIKKRHTKTRRIRVSQVAGALIEYKGALYVVTAAHGFSKDPLVETYDICVQFKYRVGYVYHVTPLVTDHDSDFSILKINDDQFRFAGRLPALGDARKLAAKDRVFALGHPDHRDLGGSWHVSSGAVLDPRYISGNTPDNPGLAGKWLIGHSCFTSGGNSGGPLINAYGEIVGVHIRRITKKEKLAVPINVIVKRLDQLIHEPQEK